MIDRDDIVSYLANYLAVDTFEDYCVNGLQVEGTPVISRIAVGVSVSERLFREVARTGADMIIVHHGLFWKNGTPHPFQLAGLLRNRVKLLLDNDINLAAYHLPLDAHPECGNNARILQLLGAELGESLDVGFMGSFPSPRSPGDIRDILRSALPDPPVHLDYGRPEIRRIGVISGGASTRVEMAAAMGADAFISGDIQEHIVRTVEELGIHYFSAGHYNSERFGPMALAEHLRHRYRVPVDFIDVPNPA